MTRTAQRRIPRTRVTTLELIEPLAQALLRRVLADDVTALENVSHDREVTDAATGVTRELSLSDTYWDGQGPRYCFED